MQRVFTTSLVLVVVLSVVGVVRGNEAEQSVDVKLKNGRTISGRLTHNNSDQITLRYQGESTVVLHTIPTSQISRVERAATGAIAQRDPANRMMRQWRASTMAELAHMILFGTLSTD